MYLQTTVQVVYKQGSRSLILLLLHPQPAAAMNTTLHREYTVHAAGPPPPRWPPPRLHQTTPATVCYRGHPLLPHPSPRVPCPCYWPTTANTRPRCRAALQPVTAVVIVPLPRFFPSNRWWSCKKFILQFF